MDAHYGRRSNWRQERKELENQLKNLTNEVLRMRREEYQLRRSAKILRNNVVTYQKREQEVNMRPIRAIFHSCGESLPPTDNDGPEVVEARLKKRQQWTGVKDFDEVVRDLDWQEKPSKPGPKPTFNNRESLLIYFIAVRQGFSFSALKRQLGLERRRAREIFGNALANLVGWSSRHLYWPTLEQWSYKTTPEFKRLFPNVLIFLVDATPFPCLSFSCPSVNRLHWNVAHSEIAKCIAFAITTDGTVVWMGPSTPGNIHDKEALNESDFCLSLATFYESIMKKIRDGTLDIQPAIGGDKGYVGAIIPDTFKMILPKGIKRWVTSDPTKYGRGHYKEFQFYSPSKQQTLMTPRLADFRGKIENVIADLKKNKLLINPEFVHTHTDIFDEVVRVSLAVVNFNHKNH